MEGISTVWILVGFVALVLGPSGAAWVGTRVAVKGLEESLRDVRTWLKGLEDRTRETDAELRVVKGILRDRDERQAKAAP